MELKMASWVIVLAIATIMPMGCLTEDLHLEYYADVTMRCEETMLMDAHSNSAQKKYWLLPGGALLYENYTNERISVNATHITILRTDDDDFGIYYCFMVWNDYTIGMIQHGLNVNGPDYGDLLSKYRHNAMVGGIAAGILFAIVSGSCLGWHYLLRRKQARQTAPGNDEAVDKLGDLLDNQGSAEKGLDGSGYVNAAIEMETVDRIHVPDGDSVTTSAIGEKL